MKQDIAHPPSFQLPRIHFRSNQERDYFIENLSMLLRSGMDVITAIEALRLEMKSKEMKFVVETVLEEIEAGSPLWRALEKVEFFPNRVISLVRLGELSGRLSDNLQVVVDQQRKERSFRSKVQSAMLYPVFVLVVTFVVGIGTSWFVLPRLARVFASFKIELPITTRILIFIGQVLQSHGLIIIPLIILLTFIAIYFLFIHPRTKLFGQDILFHLPIVHSLLLEVELARFGFILGSLLESGLPVVEAITSLHEIPTLARYQKFYLYLQSSVIEGNSFRKSFEQYKDAKKLIPAPVQQMIIAGEQSGNLSSILLHIGTIFEERTDTTAKNLSVILEPILLIFIWVGVFFVAVAVIIPLYSLIGGIN